jgi:beta-mannanase
MRTLEQLEQRKEELLDELSTYMWWGNEDDVDFKEEYADEYSHLQTELYGVQTQIWKIKYQSRQKFN